VPSSRIRILGSANSTRNCHALPLPAGQFHPAFTHNRVISIREAIDELFAMRDAKLASMISSRVACGWGEPDVFGDGAVKKKVYPGAQHPSGFDNSACLMVDRSVPIDQLPFPKAGLLKAITKLISVLFP